MGDRLKGKVAFVTGASSGIGRTTAKRFAAEGATVVLAARRKELLDELVGEIEAAGGKATALVLDVGDLDRYAEVLRETAKRFGHLDILVNNAMADSYEMIADSSLDNWRRNFLINADAVFVSTRECFRLMRETGGGAIVNIASICGTRALPLMAAYSASKAAMIQFTAVAGVEGAPQNIRVNCIVPGSVDTPANPAETDYAKASARAIPMLRAGRADELANAILFLASDEASYITGTCLAVDGGKAAQLYVPTPG